MAVIGPTPGAGHRHQQPNSRMTGGDRADLVIERGNASQNIATRRHRLQHAARMARGKATEGNLARRQRIPEPDAQRAGFHANPFESFGPFCKPAVNCIRACRHLGFGQKPTIPILGGGGAGIDVIIDFRGFPGMGKSQVAIGCDELTVLVADDDDIRRYPDAPNKQVQDRRKPASIRCRSCRCVGMIPLSATQVMKEAAHAFVRPPAVQWVHGISLRGAAWP